MTLLETVREATSEVTSSGETGDSVYLNTFCIYPSNGFVQVVIYGDGNSFVVSDDGGAINEIVSAGVAVAKSDKTLARFAADRDLLFKAGCIQTRLCSRNLLPVAISLVANASKEMADWMFDTAKIKRSRDFKVLLRQFLSQTFRDRVKNDVTIVGASNKAHRFENVVYLSNERRIIIDPVGPDHSSISSRIVANMDVRLKNIEGLEQRIVYDDEDNWKVEDLNLLQVGSPIIRFSTSPDAIRKLAQLS